MELFAFITVIALCFYLLAVVCEDFFVPSLDILSRKLKMTSDVAGATLMAVGSSAPELFTSFFAVIIAGSAESIGAGAVVGSAMFNVLVITGISATYKAVKLSWQPVIRDVIFYSISILVLLVAFADGIVTSLEAFVFIAVYVLYIVAVINWEKVLPHKDVKFRDIAHAPENHNRWRVYSRNLLGLFLPDVYVKPKRYMVTFLASIIIIGVLSYILVESAVAMAFILSIEPVIVALTVLAIGTSIPDLLSSVVVAKQGRGDMAISNIFGSNIFDILICLGLPWFIVTTLRGESVNVDTENLTSSVILIFASLISLIFLLFYRKWNIEQNSGFILIGAYIIYLAYVIISSVT